VHLIVEAALGAPHHVRIVRVRANVAPDGGRLVVFVVVLTEHHVVVVRLLDREIAVRARVEAYATEVL